jgi:hypothetical protein
MATRNHEAGGTTSHLTSPDAFGQSTCAHWLTHAFCSTMKKDAPGRTGRDDTRLFPVRFCTSTVGVVIDLLHPRRVVVMAL